MSRRTIPVVILIARKVAGKRFLATLLETNWPWDCHFVWVTHCGFSQPRVSQICANSLTLTVETSLHYYAITGNFLRRTVNSKKSQYSNTLIGGFTCCTLCTRRHFRTTWHRFLHMVSCLPACRDCAETVVWGCTDRTSASTFHFTDNCRLPNSCTNQEHVLLDEVLLYLPDIDRCIFVKQ
jgi:hypothetical protein